MMTWPTNAGAVGVAILLFAPAAARAGGEGPIHSTYQELRASGCDLSKTPVYTPVVARLLRNVPFAVQGYVFKSDELTAAYKADGDWYKPNPDLELVLDDADTACVQRLKVEEKRRRTQVSLPEAFEKLLTADPAGFQALKTWGKALAEPGPKDSRDISGPKDGQWTLSLLVCELPPADMSKEDLEMWADTSPCSGLQLECRPDDGCFAIVAG